MKNDQVLKYVDANYVLSLTRDMIRIPSESAKRERSKDRSPLIRLIEEQLQALGLKTRQITMLEGKPDIYAEIQGAGAGPTLLLTAHAGTVDVTDQAMEAWSSDPFSPDIKDGKLYGVGASDDKSGVAVVIGAVKAILESGAKFKGKLCVLFGTAGEGDPDTNIAMLQRNLFPKVDGIIAIDASDGKIVRQYKGRMWLEFIVHGRSVHACDPEAGINAVDKMYDVIQALKKIRFIDHDDPYLGKVTLTVTSIDAINIVNSVPGKCKITADMRMIPGLTSDDALGRMQAVLENLKRKDKDLNVVMNVLPNTIKEACEIPLEHPLVQAADQAMQEVLGRAEYAPGVMSGEGYFYFKYGLSSIFLGPGSIFNAHQPNEYVEIPRLEEITKVAALATLNYLG